MACPEKLEFTVWFSATIESDLFDLLKSYKCVEVGFLS